MNLVIYRTGEPPQVVKINPATDNVEFQMGLDFGYVWISRPGRPGETIELADGDKAVLEALGTQGLEVALKAFLTNTPLNEKGGE